MINLLSPSETVKSVSRTSLIDKQTLGENIFYRCSMWFDPSKHLLMDKQTLGEGVLQVFGVVPNL